MYFPHINLFKRFPKLGYLGPALFLVNLAIDVATGSWMDVGIDILTYALVYTGHPYAIALALGISAGWAVYKHLIGLGWSPVSAAIMGIVVGAVVTTGIILLILFVIIVLV
jgi:hypothetical protein